MTITHVTRAILLGASLTFASSLHAQGLSYDMSTTGTMPDRTGAITNQNFMIAHGQFADGMSRLDVSTSLEPGGMMGAGTYMITSRSKGTITSVDPAKHQYTVIDIAELGKAAKDAQAAMGGISKTEIVDVKVGIEDLGAGEPLDGYATYKYKLTQSYTMNMTIMGHTISTPSQSTTDIWIAPQLDGLMDPNWHSLTGVATGPRAELTRQLSAAYAKMRKGLMLKSVTTTEGGTAARKRAMTMTTMITNVKKTAISRSVFEIPAGYTQVAILDEMTSGATARRGRPE